MHSWKSTLLHHTLTWSQTHAYTRNQTSNEWTKKKQSKTIIIIVVWLISSTFHLCAAYMSAWTLIFNVRTDFHFFKQTLLRKLITVFAELWQIFTIGLQTLERGRLQICSATPFLARQTFYFLWPFKKCVVPTNKQISAWKPTNSGKIDWNNKLAALFSSVYLNG